MLLPWLGARRGCAGGVRDTQSCMCIVAGVLVGVMPQRALRAAG